MRAIRVVLAKPRVILVALLERWVQYQSRDGAFNRSHIRSVQQAREEVHVQCNVQLDRELAPLGRVEWRNVRTESTVGAGVVADEQHERDSRGHLHRQVARLGRWGLAPP